MLQKIAFSVSVLDEFEDNMLNMIQRVEFKTTCAATDSLQAKLDKDRRTRSST